MALLNTIDGVFRTHKEMDRDSTTIGFVHTREMPLFLYLGYIF
jgi:hypothetical protein